MAIKQYFSSVYGSLTHQIVDHSSDRFTSFIEIEPSESYQTIIGFGGAFTEAAAYTLSLIDKKKRRKVLESYFDPQHGLGYRLGRVHINSSDFSLGNYDYVDEGDVSLNSFDISREYQYVIPMIKEAEAIAQTKISLLASPWSPPAWMKTNNCMNHGGELKPEYFEAWARYYVKFIDAFKKEGLSIDYVSVQNEPAAKQIWDSCLYTAEQERDFVRDYLGPILHQAHPDVKIIIWDHNRDVLVERGDTVLKDLEAREHVWGTGIHWYVSEAFEHLSELHHLHPDKHLLFTEGCIEGGPRVGDWRTGERYARNMIGDFRNYCEGYLDWNLALNEEGGPNHVGNYCDAPVICDTKNNQVHYNSSHTYISHFSKHIPTGSKRIASQSDNQAFVHVAFETPDGDIVLIILNETEEAYQVNIPLFSQAFDIKPRSIMTLIKEH